MASSKQERDFSDEMLGEITVENSSLNTAIDWIRNNLKPDDIFGDDTLREYVAKVSMPQDVFEEKELIDWAESNGYSKHE